MTEVTATLSLLDRNDRTVAEAEIPGLGPDAVWPLSRQEGTVSLHHAGHREDFGDDLSYLISMLCTDLPARLRDDGEVIHAGFANPEVVTFTRAGPKVTLSGEYRSPVDYPAQELIAALASVAQRFPAMLAALWPDLPQEERDGYAEGARLAAEAAGDAPGA